MRTSCFRHRTWILWTLSLPALVATPAVWSQENQEPAEPAQAVVAIQSVSVADGDGPQMIIASPQLGVATFSGDAMGLGMGGFSPFMSTNKLQMLMQEQFLEELELVEEQRDQLKNLRQRIQEKQRELFSGIRSVDPTKMRTYLNDTQGLIQDEVDEELKKVLLPNQYKRLSELQVQLKMRGQGVAALAGPDFAEMLGLTDEQRQELQEKQLAAMKELQKQMAEIRQKLEKDILEGVLTAPQRKKLEELTGKQFELQTPESPLMKRIQQSLNQN